ncbi:hypothetical protein D9757_012993 [Collybiopsis confluens]|uniref:Uncharacterized protein n=1 Tax=Collybiopsis confluens TaxID=2823264 RepID=A0A8H5GI89_9AGAR|nr:hypothetical protein D9757_012993 [Collybiopsis confluens]
MKKDRFAKTLNNSSSFRLSTKTPRFPPRVPPQTLYRRYDSPLFLFYLTRRRAHARIPGAAGA